MRRREFVTLVGGAVAWPIAARAQQSARVRRIGVLAPFADDDTDAKDLLAAFQQGLQVLVSVFAGASPSSMAQQPADQPSVHAPASATIDAATAAAIAAEGELKATIRTFQGDNPSAVYRYYWWHDSCYVRYQSGTYELVTSDYCHH